MALASMNKALIRRTPTKLKNYTYVSLEDEQKIFLRKQSRKTKQTEAALIRQAIDLLKMWVEGKLLTAQPVALPEPTRRLTIGRRK